MEISGSYTFDARAERVWSLLMDPAVLAACIPGCDRLEPDGEDRYAVTMTIGLAAITGTYSGTVLLTDKVPSASYRLIAEGQGRPGFVKGSASVTLRPDAGRFDRVAHVRSFGAVETALPLSPGDFAFEFELGK